MERSEPDFSVVEAAAYLGLDVKDYQWRRDWPKVIAKWRVEIADAMIAEDREGEK
jgi:hypothetical protein